MGDENMIILEGINGELYLLVNGEAKPLTIEMEPILECDDKAKPESEEWHLCSDSNKDTDTDDEEYDEVNHPEHYTSSGMECIDEMVLVFGKEVVSHFCLCNTWKYRKRAPFKGKMIQDMDKSDWYLAKYGELKEGAYNEFAQPLKNMDNRVRIINNQGSVISYEDIPYEDNLEYLASLPLWMLTDELQRREDNGEEDNGEKVTSFYVGKCEKEYVPVIGESLVFVVSD